MLMMDRIFFKGVYENKGGNASKETGSLNNGYNSLCCTIYSFCSIHSSLYLLIPYPYLAPHHPSFSQLISTHFEAGGRWAPSQAFTTGLLFTLPGVRRWAPGQTFITSRLFIFPEARDKRAPGLHIYDWTLVCISRSAPRYKNQQQKQGK